MNIREVVPEYDVRYLFQMFNILTKGEHFNQETDIVLQKMIYFWSYTVAWMFMHSRIDRI